MKQNGSAPRPSLLAVVRDKVLLDVLADVFDSHDFHLSVATNPYKAPEYCKVVYFDVVVLDMDFPECQSGVILDMLAEVSPVNPMLQFILLSTMPPSLELIPAGLQVYSYLLKPFDPGWLIRSVTRASEHCELEREMNRLTSRANEQSAEVTTLHERVRYFQKRSSYVEMAGSLTHELKNLLSIIKVSAHFMLMKAREARLEAKLVKHLEIVSQQVDRGQEQIIRFANYIRGEDQGEQLCSVNGVIRDLLSLLEYSLVTHNISVRTDLQEDIPPVMLQEAALRHIVLNLILNARDAMSEGGCVSIHTALHGRTEGEPRNVIDVWVEDSGPGVSEANLERIFEPFFTTKHDVASTGLGLSISRQLASSFGGTLAIVPQRGVGARFLLTIPVEDLLTPSQSGAIQVPRETDTAEDPAESLEAEELQKVPSSEVEYEARREAPRSR